MPRRSLNVHKYNRLILVCLQRSPLWWGWLHLPRASTLSTAFTPAEVDAMIALADSDGDGQVTL